MNSETWKCTLCVGDTPRPQRDTNGSFILKLFIRLYMNSFLGQVGVQYMLISNSLYVTVCAKLRAVLYIFSAPALRRGKFCS